MYRLSKRREMSISNTKTAIWVKNHHTDEIVELPIQCWETLLKYMKDIDDLIPRLSQGLKVDYVRRLGFGWLVKVRTAYQCILIRREECKIDTRNIPLLVGYDWTALHTVLPRILNDAHKPIPHQYYTPPPLEPDYTITIPGLDGEW